MIDTTNRPVDLTPLLRGAAMTETVRPLVHYQAEPIPDAIVLPADGDAEGVASAWRDAVGAELPKAVTIEGVGTWQVTAPERSGRLAGCIAVVTGGAQGFGAGIARELAQEGAYLVIADINGEGARGLATELEDEFGQGAAIGLDCDVTNDAAVASMIDQVVLAYGGVDLMISNAGIVRSGSVKDLEFADFELVTRVNYDAFFLCAKYASRVMAATHKACPTYTADIIQVNSKSGLMGSNRNSAYAGSKFGGIGLVQSFALELVEDGIKVNAICPGNFFEGPLWSDPEDGLFAQYLAAGKIPGAKTIEDVRHAYESKVPMGRGCGPRDVVRAILYAVEQDYETGQAIPVTGGQVMLR
jgi:sorbitol-6-phosphate 2-dehydrogenase